MLEFPKAKSVVVSGDIHGDFTQLVFKCCVQYAMTDTLIIVAGDCGFGFEREGYYEGVYKSPNVYWHDEAPVFDRDMLDAIDQMCAILFQENP